ncbi:MAG: flavin reductase family protein [Candidatus Caenarcaniphilales bacterium]|nr:flavin reductase family protein [Candidatus Caenarcaniphilales bacterium]
MKKLLKQINYSVFSVTTAFEDILNANIATWVMQSSMQGKMLVVALDKEDFTIELVKKSKILNINLLASDQTSLINKLGRKSGRDIDKFKKLNFKLDQRGCPILLDSIGYIQCEVEASIDSLDHEVFSCAVLKQITLNKDKASLTINDLREKKLVRG